MTGLPFDRKPASEVLMRIEMTVNSSLHPFDGIFCPQAFSIHLSLIIICFFITPLLVFILFEVCQQWRKKRHGSARPSSHVDILTYNVVIQDLLGTTGISLMFFSTNIKDQKLWTAGMSIFGLSSTGQTLFHLLTCIERYLAVIHPIFYLRLRGPLGVRIRNITVGCTWLISFLIMSITLWCNVPHASTSFVLLSIISVAFFFCSLSVLCALNRSRPGESEGNRERTDQSRQRAFHTMVIITGTLSLRFVNSLVTSIIQILTVPFGYVFCIIGWSSVLLLLPSSLVMPLLFLKRRGKLKLCGQKTNGSA